MAEIHVLDNIPFGSPKFRNHLELAQLCVGPIERNTYMSQDIPGWEWEKTSRSTLRDLGVEGGAPYYQRPIATRLYAATELIGVKMPEENPELQLVLCSLGRAFDAELEIRKVTPKLDELEIERSSAIRELLTQGVRGVSLADIENVTSAIGAK